MAKDDFWNNGAKSERAYARISDTLNAAAMREALTREAAAQEAERLKREAEEEAQKPKPVLCKACGEMTTKPCQP